jgi:hypothetical protein
MCAACILLTAAPARAQAGPPAAHEDTAFDFMNELTYAGLHNIHDEAWNTYGQFTYIGNYKPPFSAPYTNANGSVNSLVPDFEYSFTGTFTLFFGLRLWPGGEGYFVPEVISERPLSQLRGIGGAIQNFELQKTGSQTPQLYRSRTFLRQTINLGGAHVEKESQPLQLAAVVDSHRLVFTGGNFTILDVFDRNSITWDPRQTFLNMAFMTYASWDFPSDARGYSYGITGELYWDDWAFRAGWITPPQNPNQLAIDFQLWQFYGLEFEWEHDHTIAGQDGAVRVLAYHNHVNTGQFNQAVQAFNASNGADNAANCGARFNYGSGNAMAPDLCFVRQPNVKVGIGLSLEQHIVEDIGVFFRGMYSDGRTEVDAYHPADRSISFGAVAKGKTWHRPFDVTGVGFGMSWASDQHARYLSLGGVDGFIGDGKLLNQGGEGVVDVFYSVNFLKAIWLTGDYQFLWNPAYNGDRGPVNIVSGRVHAEF